MNVIHIIPKSLITEKNVWNDISKVSLPLDAQHIWLRTCILAPRHMDHPRRGCCRLSRQTMANCRRRQVYTCLYISVYWQCRHNLVASSSWNNYRPTNPEEPEVLAVHSSNPQPELFHPDHPISILFQLDWGSLGASEGFVSKFLPGNWPAVCVFRSSHCMEAIGGSQSLPSSHRIDGIEGY